jgi:hypothetical protein
MPCHASALSTSPHQPYLPLNLTALPRQKLTEPQERLLRLRSNKVLHRLEQMRRDMLVEVDARGAAVRDRVHRRLLLCLRAGMRRRARRRWRRGCRRRSVGGCRRGRVGCWRCGGFGVGGGGLRLRGLRGGGGLELCLVRIARG